MNWCFWRRKPYDKWDCLCHERQWGKPYFMNHINGPGWFTDCRVCHDWQRLAETRQEAERMLAAREAA